MNQQQIYIADRDLAERRFGGLTLEAMVGSDVIIAHGSGTPTLGRLVAWMMGPYSLDAVVQFPGETLARAIHFSWIHKFLVPGDPAGWRVAGSRASEKEVA